MAVDPIHQFQIDKLFTIGHIGGQEIAFTNSSAYMFASVAVISLLMIGGTRGRQLVPGRIQSLAELIYEFVASMIRGNVGPEGMRFFPLVFSLFTFIMVSNVIGIIPYAQFQAILSSPRRWRCWCSSSCCFMACTRTA
jgi:F-type H+-transporting ATPase subunit a